MTKLNSTLKIYTLTLKGLCLKSLNSTLRNDIGVFSEFETNLRRERQADGIAAAKNKGVYKGRPPSIDQDKIKQHLLEGKRPTQIAKELEISRGTIYKIKQLITLKSPIVVTNLDTRKLPERIYHDQTRRPTE